MIQQSGLDLDIYKWEMSMGLCVELAIANLMVYPLVDCEVSVKRIVKTHDSEYKFPFDDKPLDWWARKQASIEIESGDTEVVRIMMLRSIEDLRFTSIPSNPNKFSFGQYIIGLELSAILFDIPTETPIMLSLDYSQNGLIWDVVEKEK